MPDDPKVVNRRYLPKGSLPENAVYVGRPSPWGNPYRLGAGRSRAQVIEHYRAWLERYPEMAERARKELRGKDLVCWCAPEPCHADVLLEIANA